MKRIWLFRFAVLFTCLSLLLMSGAQVKGNALVTTPPLHMWTAANVGGFGDIKNISVSAMAVYNGSLYAGIYNWSQQPGTGGSIWRYDGGTGWTKIPTPGDSGQGYTNTGFTTPFNYAILGMKVFNNKLYVSTGWGAQMGRVWRYDGSTWEKVLEVSDVNQPVYGFTALEVFNGMIFVGVSNQNTDTPGTRIYRSSTGNLNSWAPVVTNGNGNPNAFNVTSLKAFGTSLFAAVADFKHGVQIWSTHTGNIGDWGTPINNGFGQGSQAADPGGFGVYNGFLYLGVRNQTGASETQSNGGALYRTSDGNNWSPVTTNGFGRPQNVKIEGLYPFGGFLYAFTSNPTTGMEVFASGDGVNFSIDTTGGFGSRYNKNTIWSNSLAEYNGALFVGTSNYNETTLAPVEGGRVFVWTPIDPATLTNMIYLPALSRP